MIKAKRRNGVSSSSTIIANAKPPMAVTCTLIWPIRQRSLRAWAVLREGALGAGQVAQLTQDDQTRKNQHRTSFDAGQSGEEIRDNSLNC
jgi:hypothetical protein